MDTGFINEPCPFLPVVDREWKATDVTSLGEDRGPVFYQASLCYAQSQWQKGLPAQALLQVNRSLACHLSADELSLPLGYKAIAWLISQRRDGQYLGNPVRHFQHLATRMVEPHKSLRTWRAWACWYLAKTMLPKVEFPGDAVQIRREQIVEPTFAQIRSQLDQLSPADDAERWLEALGWLSEHGLSVSRVPDRMDAPEFEILPPSRLHEITELAFRIWPQVYPGIITQDQIDYMLRWMYSAEALQRDVSEKGLTYALIRHGDHVAGYVGFGPEGDAMFLHKLYILPEMHGQGLGAAGIDWVRRQSLARGFQQVKLRVNKNNVAALRAYLRQGFEFEQDIVADIGGGFVMDDYVMTCRIGN